MLIQVFESDEICHEVLLPKNKFIWKLSHHSIFFNNTSDIHHTPGIIPLKGNVQLYG
jgi:hypothetical protein